MKYKREYKFIDYKNNVIHTEITNNPEQVENKRDRMWVLAYTTSARPYYGHIKRNSALPSVLHRLPIKL